MTTTQEPGKTLNFASWGNAGWLIGVLALAGGLAVMFGGDRAMATNMMHSWIFAWGFFMALTIGCYGLTLLHHIVRGSWGLAVLRLLEAGGGALALFTMAVAFVPILMNLPTVYALWFTPNEADTYIMAKVAYLNQWAFIGRFIAFFGLWIGIAALLRRSSLRQDASKAKKEQDFRTNLSVFGFIMLFITGTLAATDWFMSLDPYWFSTIFGPLWLMVGANMALALVTLIVVVNAKSSPYKDILSPDVTRDLGNLVFATTMLWIYFTLSQFLIIWSGNLPEFSTFYYKRQVESQFLLYLGTANVFFGWFVPWMALLAPRVKKGPTKMIAWVCGGIFVMRIIDIYWNFMPLMRPVPALPMWTDAVALVAIGGLWLGAFGRTTGQAALTPAHDTRLEEARELSHA